jgi:hypothetical protein
VIILCDVDRVAEWNCGELCKTNSNPIDFYHFYSKVHDIMYMIYYNSTENSVKLVFRGSEPTLKNLIVDLDIVKVAHPACD